MTRSIQKQYGQFFTDPFIADMMVKWATKNNPRYFLDPAVGPGIFPKTAFRINSQMNISVVEIDEEMAKKFKEENSYPVNFIQGDYLTWKPSQKFDAIVANPPYNKFQAIPNRGRYLTDFLFEYQADLSGYTNQCIYFFIKSLNELSVNGRCCYIVPYEFLNTGYGIAVKEYLLKKRTLKGILKFDTKESLFSDAITTSCVLFAENRSLDGCFFINSSNIDNLTTFDFDAYIKKNPQDFQPYKTLNPSEKWLTYFKKDFQTRYRNLIKLSDIGRVQRGIATGNNNFFTLSQSSVKKLGLSENACIPCITKSPDITSIIFDKSELKFLKEQGKKVYLFDGTKSQNAADFAYINYGESMGFHKTYLTQHRNPWYSLENKPIAPIWISVFSRGKIKVIRNEASIKNLTNFHGFFPHNPNNEEINILFCYLLTPIANDILKQNKREYGNGLNKFEPGDLNEAYILNIKKLSIKDRDFILGQYELLRKKEAKEECVILKLNELFKRYLESPSSDQHRT